MILAIAVSLALAVFPVNVPPVYVGPLPGTITIDEDDSPSLQTYPGFATGIFTELGVGSSIASWGGSQRYFFDIEITDQAPALPHVLFSTYPRMNPASGVCSDVMGVEVCAPPISNLEFQMLPEVSGWVDLDLIIRDDVGGEYRRPFRINILEKNDPSSFELFPNGRRRIEVYEDSCNEITGFVYSHDQGKPWEHFGGEQLEYQLFPSTPYNYATTGILDIFQGDLNPGVCDHSMGSAYGACENTPQLGRGAGHTGLKVSYPAGTLSFCMAEDAVDTVDVAMHCIDYCTPGQLLIPDMVARNWPCTTDPPTYCPQHQFEIAVLPVNDPPGRCPDPQMRSITVSECTEIGNTNTGGCPHSYYLYPVSGNGWMTPGGGPDERTQRVHVEVTEKEPNIYEERPEFDEATGRLTFKLKTFANTFDNKDVITLSFHDDGGVNYQWCSGHSGPICPYGSDARYCPIILTITAVNEPPLWEKGSDPVIWEDDPLLRISGFASKISAGIDPNEQDQKLSFSCSTNDSSLVDVAPRIETPSGDLEFKPAENQFGVLEVTCGLSDQIDVTEKTFLIYVQPVNDCPSFNVTQSRVYCEEGSSFSEIVGIPYAGAPNEAGQTFGYQIWLHPRFGLGEIFNQPPSIDENSMLTFSCLEGKQGSTTIRATVTDSGQPSSIPPHCNEGQAVDLTLVCLPHNNPPSFEIVDDVVVWKNEGLIEIERHAIKIDKGHPLEGHQTLRFELTEYDTSLFVPNSLSIDPMTGKLTFTTAQDKVGTTLVTAHLYDDGDAPWNVSPPVTFRITIRPETAPTFTPGETIYIPEDTLSIDQLWATEIDAGGLLPYHFEVDPSCQNDSLFSTPLTVTKDVGSGGILNVDLVTDANGMVTCPVCIVNSDNSTCEDLNIVIYKVNDPPVFNVLQPNVTIQEDAGNIIVNDVLGGAVAGPPDEQLYQKIEFVVHVSSTADDDHGQHILLSPPVVLNNSHLLIHPAPDAWGETTLIINCTDYSLDSKSLSTTHTVHLTVSPINDLPGFIPGDNVSINAAEGKVILKWASDVTAGAEDEQHTQTVSFSLKPVSVESANSSASITDLSPLFVTNPQLSSDGTLQIDPVLTAFGDVVFEVVLSDDGSPSASSEAAYLKISLSRPEVYVPPSWTDGIQPNKVINVVEDSGSYQNMSWGRLDMPPSKYNSKFKVNVVSGGSMLIGSPSVSEVGKMLPNGTQAVGLSFSVGPDRFGDIHFEFSIEDDIGESDPYVFTIQITPVNDPPSFTIIERSRVIHIESPSETLTSKIAWAVPELTTAGPFEDGIQTVEFITNDTGIEVGIFDIGGGAQVDNEDGTISFTVKPNVEGIAVASTYAQDNGGLVDNGIGSPLKTDTVGTVIRVTSSKVFITTTLPQSLSDWNIASSSSSTASAAEIAAKEAEIAALEKKLLQDPANIGLKNQLQTENGKLASMKGESVPLRTDGGVLPISEENSFVTDFRKNISSALNIEVNEIAIDTVSESPSGAVIIWSTTNTTTSTFMGNKGNITSGFYINSTIPSLPTLTPWVSQPPSPGDPLFSDLELALLIVGCVLAVVLIAAAIWKYKSSPDEIKSKPEEREFENRNEQQNESHKESVSDDGITLSVESGLT
eukprot:TRINITY_DN13296_c0_g1_i2.p1 TRINITY_DN13296_c0_g1~~TRINITY_DN13296_c0_g1_i2.p1  ORF type:complete len:1614 (+),score=390.44 TRINITY_DN13296_c0_g1_i2:85-4926(+)